MHPYHSLPAWATPTAHGYAPAPGAPAATYTAAPSLSPGLAPALGSAPYAFSANNPYASQYTQPQYAPQSYGYYASYTQPAYSQTPYAPPSSASASDSTTSTGELDAPLYPSGAPVIADDAPLYPPSVIDDSAMQAPLDFGSGANDYALTAPQVASAPPQPAPSASTTDDGGEGSQSTVRKDKYKSNRDSREKEEEEEVEEAAPLREREGKIPTIGSAETMNLARDLHMAIMNNEYFKALYHKKTFHEVLQLIETDVEHLDPWESQIEILPSYAFCLLLKFFKMRLTYKQMKNLLDDDCEYARGIGLLYLRFCTDPKELWEWFEPLFSDRSDISLSSNGSSRLSIGIFAKKLLTEPKHHGQMLPRIPVPRMKEFATKLERILPDKRRSRSPERRRSRSRSPRRDDRDRERSRRERSPEPSYRRRSPSPENRRSKESKEREKPVKRERSTSPSLSASAPEAKKPRVDIAALEKLYGSSSDAYTSAVPNVNENLGAAETLKLGYSRQ